MLHKRGINIKTNVMLIVKWRKACHVELDSASVCRKIPNQVRNDQRTQMIITMLSYAELDTASNNKLN
jgi:hypothetical protein